MLNEKVNIDIPADGIYRISDDDLVEGDRCDLPEGKEIEIARKNADLIQNLLDTAGKNGGGIVLLPKGIYCISGDTSVFNNKCLVIRYDNITLTGEEDSKNEDGSYKTVLKSSFKWDGPNGIFRSNGIYVEGTEPNSSHPRQNIRISHFELDGGRGWNGVYDWGYDITKDYGWDIGHKGISVAWDRFVSHVTLEDMYVHKFSGETVYVGGQFVGFLDVKDCKFTDTNASCFNLYAAVLRVRNTQFGAPEGRCRFWIEYSPRNSFVKPSQFMTIPDGLEFNHAYITNNKFYNSVGAHGIAIAQGDSDISNYTMVIENNFFDNTLSNEWQGIFQFCGGIYGPTYIKNNKIRNCHGPVIVFDYGGGTVPLDNLKNKNIWLENNDCKNLSGLFISLVGTWGIWDAKLQKPVPAVCPVENLYVRENNFEGTGAESVCVAMSNNYGDLSSAVDLNNIVIENNIFKNCTAPEEQREFLGNVPLFKNNKYIDVIESRLGAINFVSSENPMLKPIYEYLTVIADEPIIASIRIRRNEDGQKVEIKGAIGTAPVTFTAGSDNYEVEKDIVLNEKDKITMQYSSRKGKWIHIK